MPKLYLTIDGVPVKLAPLDPKIEAAIQSDITAGKVLFELKPEFWSGAANNLPNNTQAVYVSGSHPSVAIPNYGDIAAAGQLGVFREQEGQQKSYRFMLVESGSKLFYGEEFKNYPDHYYSGNHPTGSIWEKMHPRWPKL
jgi:hypothetical protein